MTATPEHLASLRGSLVYVLGRQAARVLVADGKGATVRRDTDDMEFWVRWEDLHENPGHYTGDIQRTITVNRRASITVIATGLLSYLAGLVTATAIFMPVVLR